MWRLILWRVLQGALVLVVVSWLTFWLLAAAGGDALDSIIGDARVSATTIENLRRVYGLDQPLGVRYARWLGGVLTGDLGFSFYYQAPVASIIVTRLLHTSLLAFCALAVALFVSIALGVAPHLLTERKNFRALGNLLNRGSSLLILFASATPRLVLALAALAIIAQTSLFTNDAANTSISFTRLVPAACVLAIPLIALFLAQIRDGLQTTLAEDFVRVARAKGLSERAILVRHALRPALNPLITIFGASIGAVMSGSIIVETVFGWSGLGQLSVIAVRARDVSLLMSVVLITASAVLLGNLAADILVRFNDPRLRRAAMTSNNLRAQKTKVSDVL